MATDAPVTLDLGGTTLRDGFVRIAGAARLQADGSVFDRASLVLEPASAAPGDGAPAIRIANSSFEGSTLWEGPAVRAGRVRLEASTVRDSTFDVRALEAVDVRLLAARLGAQELLALGGELTDMEVRAADGAFSALTLTDVVFAECRALRFFGAELVQVDAPECPPRGLRIEASNVLDANLAGGVSLVESRLEVSVVGAGPTSTIHTEGSDLEAVTLCDVGAGAFVEGSLRCVKCDEDAFMGGAAVCVAGARIFERGCPAIELAPGCP